MITSASNSEEQKSSAVTMKGKRRNSNVDRKMSNDVPAIVNARSSNVMPSVVRGNSRNRSADSSNNASSTSSDEPSNNVQSNNAAKNRLDVNRKRADDLIRNDELTKTSGDVLKISAGNWISNARETRDSDRTLTAETRNSKDR